MYKFDLKYSDLNSLTEDLKYKCRIDIKSYSLGAIKRMVGGYMDKHNIEGPNDLIRWLNVNPGNKNDFMRSIIPNKTEFFRDPGLWRYLNQELPNMVSSKGEISVLDLGCSTGEEIYSMSLIADELGLSDKISLTGVEKYQVKLDQMKEAEYPVKEIESCDNNYSRYKQGGSFKQYVDRGEDTFKLDKKFVSKVETKLFDLTTDRAFKSFDILLCRNVMCYINLKKSRPIYKLLSDFTKKGGLLILGVQEDLSNSFYSRDFECINEEFKVYRKLK